MPPQTQHNITVASFSLPMRICSFLTLRTTLSSMIIPHSLHEWQWSLTMILITCSMIPIVWVMICSNKMISKAKYICALSKVEINSEKIALILEMHQSFLYVVHKYSQMNVVAHGMWSIGSTLSKRIFVHNLTYKRDQCNITPSILWGLQQIDWTFQFY